jgi:hypothetical protein
MNRVNFALGSHLVLDVCKPHGTWFDKHELRRMVEFIRAGGLEKARAHQIAQLQEERRRFESSRNIGATIEMAHASGWEQDEHGLLDDFLRLFLP